MTLGFVALIFQLFWLVTGFSIGLYYLPAAMAMTVAAVLNAISPSAKPPSAPEVGSTQGSQDFDDFVRRSDQPVD